MTKVATKPKRIVNRASTPGGGKSPAELVRQANRWRDNYNPLRGLVISRVVSILESAERGDFAELQLTMRKLERRYPVLKGLKARRLSALEKLDWDVKVVEELPEGATPEMAEAQRKYLRSRYELVENLTETFGFLVTAEFRGYAIAQKHRITGGSNDGAVREFHWLPQDQFSRAGQFGDFYFNKDSQFGVGGDACQQTLGEKNRIGSEELPREDFLLREVDAPLYEIALIAFVNWAMGRKDYAAFVEIFGLPNCIVVMPPNIPTGKEDEYRASAEQVANGVSGAVPAGADVKFPTASVRGNSPFKEYCDAQDADVVLAGTGGRLAMLTADKGGLGDGPTQEHADAFDEIAQADARKINLTLQRDFDKIELAAQFPDQPVLAYFELCAVEQEDVKTLVDNVARLEAVGFQFEPEEISEKIGLKLVRVESPNPTLPPKPDQPSETELPIDDEKIDAVKNREGDARTAIAAALSAKIDPVAALINRITAIKDDAAMMEALTHLLAHADKITDAVAADATRTQAALEQITAPALASGLKGQSANA